MDTMNSARARGLTVLRVLLGFGFLYAGLEKVFDFTGSGEPWSAFGFLKFGTGGTIPNMVGHTEPMTHNPTQALWTGLAANPATMDLINFLVVAGEIGIGIALIIGLATRLAGILGAVMMFLFWIATWDFQYGIVNQQFVYMLLSAFLAYASAGKDLGVDAILERTDAFERSPALRAVIG
jgi:thiosulfate dehydrogenase (quinone) large subunit